MLKSPIPCSNPRHDVYLRHSIARDQRPLRPKSARDHSRSAMGLPSMMAMSMLLRRLDATITIHGFRGSFRDWAAETGAEFSGAEQCLAHAIGSDALQSADLDARTPQARTRVVGVNCLRRQCGRASQGRGVIPVASSPRYGSPAPWEIGAGQARLRQLLQCGMMTPVLTSVEAAENMAITLSPLMES
jgi:hypothetical protein